MYLAAQAVFTEALSWIKKYVTDENAYHIQRILEQLLANVGPWALRIVRNHTEATQLQCAISRALIMLAESLLELNAIVEDKDRYAAMDTANGRKKVILQAKQLSYYRGKLEWSEESIEREEVEVFKLMRKLDVERDAGHQRGEARRLERQSDGIEK